MERNVYAEQIKKHFFFLIEELGFVMLHERYFPDLMGNSDIVFQSKNVGVRCLLDRGIVEVRIGPVAMPMEKWFDLSIIVGFLAPNAPSTLFFSADDFFSDQGKTSDDEWTEKQVKRLAQIARGYCEPVLRGEFERWQELGQFRERKGELEYKRLTGKDYPKGRT